MPWPHGDPERIVRSILTQPEFRSLTPTTHNEPQRSLLETILNWLWDHIVQPLFHPIEKALSASQGVGTALGVVLIVVALGAFAFIVVRLVVAFVRPTHARDGHAPFARSLTTQRTSIDWRAFAREAAACGDFGSAIAALFAAALVALDERSVIAFDAARTPGEYRRLVRRANGAAAPAFDELSDRFVRAAYAPKPPASSDFEAAERAFAAFVPAVAR